MSATPPPDVMEWLKSHETLTEHGVQVWVEHYARQSPEEQQRMVEIVRSVA